ncbi:hypothetical protein ABT126_04500 [Streptomyces sp. NPDC002012]|uniref:hypothetical protein n=1 Tax=unclassified Streptomyces TaxID=2593676 RepID=UPI003319649A
MSGSLESRGVVSHSAESGSARVLGGVVAPLRPALGQRPETYDPKLDVDSTPLREQDLTTAGLGQAA